MAERAILACIAGPAGSWDLDDDVVELQELAASAGAEPLAAVLQRHARYNSATLFSRGKVEELTALALAHEADTVLCNRDLSPRQQLRLEEATGRKVIDRTRLILDIFASRARSREGRIQVELAQWLYLLPRLSGLGRDLSRTGGGIGTRGPGETKLTADRRRVRARIAALRADLTDVAATRQVQRGGRRRGGLPLVALVGYTNAGKSTMHRALCASDALVADVLFATLDPTTRIMPLATNRRALLTDTVGFVHDLPHTLIAAFSATLEEVREADVLLEVVDQSHPRHWEQRAAVEGVLTELGAADLPRILVWNKADRPAAQSAPSAAASRPAAREDLPGVAVSALRGDGLPELRALLVAALPDTRREVRATLPFGSEPLLHQVRSEGEVVSIDYLPTGVTLVARCDPALAAAVEAAAVGAAPT